MDSKVPRARGRPKKSLKKKKKKNPNPQVDDMGDANAVSLDELGWFVQRDWQREEETEC